MCSQKKYSKIALSLNDDKRLQTSDRVTIYIPIVMGSKMVCKAELLENTQKRKIRYNYH